MIIPIGIFGALNKLMNYEIIVLDIPFIARKQAICVGYSDLNVTLSNKGTEHNLENRYFNFI